MSGATVVLVTGRDPRRYPACAHSSYVRAHAYAAVRAGYDVHIICLDRNKWTDLAAYGTVHALKTPVRMVRQNLIPLHSPFLARAAAMLVTRLGDSRNIIHGFGVWGHSAVRACQLLAGARTRCVSLVSSYTTYLDESESQWRGLGSDSNLRVLAKYALEQAWIRAVVSRYERVGYQKADRVIVNYRTVQRMVVARFGPKVQCEIIPYTIEKEFEHEQLKERNLSDKRSRKLVIVSIAQHQPRKGVDILLRALQGLRQSGISFFAYVIGGGLLLETHRRLLKTLQLSDCVEMPGIVENVGDYLARADIFVLPSREEQSGSLALLEAMRAGVACIASACDGIPEDVTHRSDAWLATPGDHESIVRGITALIEDPSLRARLAIAGQKTFRARFSGTTFARVLDRVYQECLTTAS